MFLTISIISVGTGEDELAEAGAIDNSIGLTFAKLLEEREERARMAKLLATSQGR